MSESQCTQDLRKAGKAYPRTCAECGLGPCKRYPPQSSYLHEGNKVLYWGSDDSKQLFLTVHPTENQTRTPEQVAAAITSFLNSDASFRYRIVGGA